jgi:hypothetical protein
MSPDKKVTIQSVNPKSIDAPTYVTPFFDHQTQNFEIGKDKFKGVAVKDHKGETVSHECLTAPLPLNTTVGRPFKHGDTFDMDDPRDALLIQMLLDQGFLCPDGERPNPSQHRFFMHNRITTAQRQVDRGTRQSEALQLVSTMKSEDRYNIAFLEKQPVRQMSLVEVDGFVYNLASTSPDRVIALHKDGAFKVRAFIEKLFAYDILKREAGGGAKYGNDVLGLSEDTVVAWMNDKANRELVQMFRAELERKGGGSLPSTVATDMEKNNAKHE